MPKQTFFNLPTEKQQTLIHAAKKEFSRVPLNEAAIANIVKDADIPRGSFYQYFADKEDAFYYLLEQQMEVHNNHFFTLVKQHNGDLFDSFIAVFRKMFKEFQEKENRDFFRNAFLNMNYKMEKKLAAGFSQKKKEEKFHQIFKEVDMHTLNIDPSNAEETKHIFEIFIAVTSHNLMRAFAQDVSYDQAVKDYSFEIYLLKAGLAKKEM